MDLRRVVRKWALSRPAVLVATLPGATRVRLATEAELRRRGWSLAQSPAAADVLVVAGEAGSALDDALGAVWGQMPYPKAMVFVSGVDRVGAALDEVGRELVAGTGAGVWPRGDSGAGHGGHEDHVVEHDEHEGHAMEHGQQHDGLAMEHGAHGGHGEHGGHADQEHAAHDTHIDHEAHWAHGDHGGHETHGGHNAHGGHGHHHGGVIAGLPMADRADDRDGLRLDQLHVPLGPVLADWPAGLVLDLALQGDVIQHAEVRHPSPADPPSLPYWNEPWLRAAQGERVSRGSAERRRCAAHLDSLSRLLAVAGWPDPAARARRLRDAALGGATAAELTRDVRTLARRVRRSRTLRRLTAGLGPLPAARARELGVTGPALAADGDGDGHCNAHDTHDRIITWLTQVEHSAAAADDKAPLPPGAMDGPRGQLDSHHPPSAALLSALPALLEGSEFAAARLIVASLDPDLDELRAEAHV
ncbi:hypothetical protein [Streptomyces boninensis]|uniref:hypothetical protein n=1 Tax=Streptomyces boninensis TaxID=2039455 RepID=UPI003B2118B4